MIIFFAQSEEEGSNKSRKDRGREEKRQWKTRETKKERQIDREREFEFEFILFYNGYKLDRMSLFIWPLIQNYNLRKTERETERERGR